MHKRKFFARCVALAALVAAAALPAAAQSYPTKPIRLVVPYAPGAITDIGARLIAERMSVILGQQVLVDNRGGAGTRIGMQQVIAAAPDGYTLLFANSVTHGSMPALSKSLAFDPIRDLVPVVPVFSYTSILVCHPSVPANTVQELIAYAKKNPGKLTNATAGPGTGHDLMGGLFNSLAGVDLLHVHYKGAGPALQDVLGGTADCIYGGGDVKQYVQSGKLKAFATSGTTRDPDFPNVPTMEEAGVKGFNVSWWQGLAAPVGTPPAVIAKLNAAANEALKDPQLLKRAGGLSLRPVGGSPADLGRMMREDMAKFAKIVKDANIPLQD